MGTPSFFPAGVSPTLHEALVDVLFRLGGGGGQWLPAAWGSKPVLCLWPWASWGTCAGLGGEGNNPP